MAEPKEMQANHGQQAYGKEDKLHVFCPVCGDVIFLVKKEQACLYSNGKEIYVCHSPCAGAMHEARAVILAAGEQQDGKE